MEMRPAGLVLPVPVGAGLCGCWPVFVVGLAVGEYVPGRGEHGVLDRDQGTAVASSCCESSVAVLEERAVGPDGGHGCDPEGSLQMGVPRPGDAHPARTHFPDHRL